MVTNLVAPSPSRTICRARSPQTAPSASRNGSRRRSRQSSTVSLPALPAGEEERHVAGRGVAVDGDRVERAVHRLAEQPVEDRRRQLRVGEDEGEHGRHVRGDHARSLGDAAYGDGSFADPRRGARALREGIGGPDRIRRRLPAIVGQHGREAGNRVRYALDVRAHADDAGRGDRDVARPAAKRGGRGPGGDGDAIGARRSGEGVGVAGVDDQRRGAAVAQHLSGPQNRRRRRGGAGGDARRGRAPGEIDQKEIVPPDIAFGARAGGQPDARHRRKRRKGVRRQWGNVRQGVRFPVKGLSDRRLMPRPRGPVYRVAAGATRPCRRQRFVDSAPRSPYLWRTPGACPSRYTRQVGPRNPDVRPYRANSDGQRQ